MTLKSWGENRENRENRESAGVRVTSAKTNFIIILIIEIMVTWYLNYPIKFYRDHDFGVKKWPKSWKNRDQPILDILVYTQ